MSLSTDGGPSTAYDIIAKVPLSGPAVLKHASKLQCSCRGAFLRRAAQHFIELCADLDNFAMLPVDVQTFIESEDFLGRRGVVYPAIMEELRELNSGKYVEAVLNRCDRHRQEHDRVVHYRVPALRPVVSKRSP